jgi:outer membrane protein TolC
MLELTRAQYKPNLSIVGQLSNTGLENNLTSAQQELMNFNKDRYYVGFKLSFDLEDRIKNEAILTQKKSEELENLNFEKVQMDLESQFKEAFQKVKTSYEVAQSADAVIQFRKKAMEENQKNYKNGKIDTAPLIDSMNKYYLSQIEYLKCLGDYHMALNEWKNLQQQPL